jgi:hypothetical protein
MNPTVRERGRTNVVYVLICRETKMNSKKKKEKDIGQRRKTNDEQQGQPRDNRPREDEAFSEDARSGGPSPASPFFFVSLLTVFVCLSMRNQSEQTCRLCRESGPKPKEDVPSIARGRGTGKGDHPLPTQSVS